MLAWFAQPGKLMCPKGVDPRRLAGEFAATYCNMSPDRRKDVSRQQRGLSLPSGRDSASPLKHGARSSFLPSGKDSASPIAREVRELRQIVNGMREEMRAYLANGNGTPRSYWRRLIERTQQEMQIRERTRRELEHEKDAAVWERKNEALRRLGLRTIPNQKEET